jgi:N-acylneuraminate cytidylyltransferase
MRVAIIPARGGSQRIPRKNIKLFCGKPIISWSIATAINSNLFDRIIVSTDDAEIASVSRGYGAEVPFIRPIDLSGHQAGTMDVICHAIEWIKADCMQAPSHVCCLYPTAPFINASDLELGYKLIAKGEWDFVFSSVENNSNTFRSFIRHVDGGVKMLFPQYAQTRSQDLPCVLSDAAQFYWGESEAWLAKKPMFSERSFPIVIPKSRAQDIDTQEDWILAENLFKFQDKQF